MNKSVDKNFIKGVAVIVVSVACCLVLALAMNAFFPSVLIAIDACLVLLVFAIGVMTVRSAVLKNDAPGAQGGALAIAAALSSLFCFVSGEMYKQTDFLTMRLDTASTYFFAIIAVSLVSYIGVGAVRFLREDSASTKEENRQHAESDAAECAETGTVGNRSTSAAASGTADMSSGSRGSSFESHSREKSTTNRGDAPQVALDNRQGKIALCVGFVILAACIVVCVSNITVQGISRTSFEEILKTVAFACAIALVFIAALVALSFLIKVAIGVFLPWKRNPEAALGEEYVLGASLVICIVILGVLLFKYPNFNFEDLIKTFGGPDFLALPVAGAVCIACFAVFVRFVCFILRCTTGELEAAKVIAKGFADKLLIWIGLTLKQIVDAMKIAPDFLNFVFDGVEDEETDRWFERFLQSDAPKVEEAEEAGERG